MIIFGTAVIRVVLVVIICIADLVTTLQSMPAQVMIPS